MSNQLLIVWLYLRDRVEATFEQNDEGSVVETVIITALFAALAIAVMAIIVAKVNAKAHSINLN
jgi:hypothetical protein